MRLWSLHPKYLDAKGLVALWRETLLAQKVLEGRTRGYKRHPQLQRFQACKKPLKALAFYLHAVRGEALKRGYAFDPSRIRHRPSRGLFLKVQRGQAAYEWRHLLAKLKKRDPKRYQGQSSVARPRVHPLFKKIAGGVEAWEKV